MPAVLEFRVLGTNTILWTVSVSLGPSTFTPIAFGPQGNCTFNFLFWSIDGRIDMNNTIHPLVGPNSVVTGWYVEDCPTIVGPPTVNFYAFSEGFNRFYPDSPVDHCSPGLIWHTGSNFVDTSASGGIVTVKKGMGIELFDSWVLTGPGAPTGSELSIQKDGNYIAVAGYFSKPAYYIPRFHDSLWAPPEQLIEMGW